MSTYIGKSCKSGHTLRYKGGGCVECTKTRVKSDQYKQKHKIWKQSEKGRALRNAQHRRYTLKTLPKQYGITTEEYHQMFADQQNLCAICKKNSKLCIDHSHSTGKVRGLLCVQCNTAIGLLQDSAAICRLAAAYLDLNDLNTTKNASRGL